MVKRGKKQVGKGKVGDFFKKVGKGALSFVKDNKLGSKAIRAIGSATGQSGFANAIADQVEQRGYGKRGRKSRRPKMQLGGALTNIQGASVVRF